MQLMILFCLNAVQYYKNYNVCVIASCERQKDLSRFKFAVHQKRPRLDVRVEISQIKHQSFALKLGLFLA